MNLRARLACAAATMVAVVVASPLPSAIAADEISDGQWFHGFLNSEDAHRTSEGSGITVAVIDTGVDATHPDLIGSVLPGVDFSPERPGTGLVDKDGHGTGMASLIAAHGRVNGIAPKAKIVPIRQSVQGRGTTAEIAKSIEWAVAHGGIQVISISLVDSADDPAVRSAVAAALAADIVVVAGVGNDPGKPVGYPAAVPGVVAVSGVNSQGQLSDASATGPAVVISAPGDGITSAGLSHGWQVGTGTSAATAIVSGSVALVRAKYPDLSAAEVVHRLTATAVDKGPAGRDAQYGYGVLDLVAALTADVPPLASAEPSKSPGAPAAPQESTWLWWVGGAVVLGLLVLVGVRSRRRE